MKNSLLPSLQPRLVELGKIKIGTKGEERKAEGGKTWNLPKKLDHFIVTGLDRGPDGRLVEDKELMATLGSDGRPLREIPIVLLSDEIPDVLHTFHALYGGRTRLASCDEETVTWYYRKGANGEPVKADPPVTAPCNGEHDKNPWKLHGIFNCVIAPRGAARWGGVYKFRTTSRISTEQLLGSMMLVKELTYGSLQGVPLRLVVRPMQVAPDAKPTTIYVVHVELQEGDVTVAQKDALMRAHIRAQQAGEMKQIERQYRALLARPETEDEGQDVADEFPPGGPDDVSGLPGAGEVPGEPAAQPKAVAVAAELQAGRGKRGSGAKRSPKTVSPSPAAATPEPLPAQEPAPPVTEAPAGDNSESAVRQTAPPPEKEPADPLDPIRKRYHAALRQHQPSWSDDDRHQWQRLNFGELKASTKDWSQFEYERAIRLVEASGLPAASTNPTADRPALVAEFRKRVFTGLSETNRGGFADFLVAKGYTQTDELGLGTEWLRQHLQDEPWVELLADFADSPFFVRP